MLGDLVEAQTECAKSFDFTSDPLVDGRLRVGQRERERDLGSGSNSFRPCPPFLPAPDSPGGPKPKGLGLSGGVLLCRLFGLVSGRTRTQHGHPVAPRPPETPPRGSFAAS